jgi:ABC-2 type transport system permease protein
MSTIRLSRFRSVSTAELRLFGRNRSALFSALVLPLILAVTVAGAGVEESGTSAAGLVVTSLLGYVLLAAVYYNLVTTYVSRREELMLKRLRAGELTDTEILTGIATPMVVVALAQMVVFVAAGAVLFGLPVPVNVLLLLAGALGGVVVFVLIAAMSTEFTRTTEAAQVTTLPVMIACLVGSMMYTALDDAPEAVIAALRALPLTPVVDLMRLGWLGTTGPAAAEGFTGVLDDALVPAGILMAWIIVGVLTVRRRFRWEPRR